MENELEHFRIRTEVRQRALRRLGEKSICCVECGEDNPVAFEKDHIEGRKHSDDLRILCKTHHAIRTSRQQTEHPPPGPNPKNVLEVGARFLLAEADYHDATGEKKRKLADILLRLAKHGITDIKD